MPTSSGPLARFRRTILPILSGPPILAFLPAITLGAYWLGGEAALMLAAFALPLVYAAAGMFERTAASGPPRDPATGLALRDEFEERVAQVHAKTVATGLRSACFLIELNDLDELERQHGQATADAIARTCGDRLMAVLRDGDMVARLGAGRFAVCLTAVRDLDLESCIQLAGRMQGSIEDPVLLDGLRLYVTCSLGFCLDRRAPGQTPRGWIDAAEAALSDALRNGPSAIRAFNPEHTRRLSATTGLADEAAAALEAGQIQPWYQPQISTETGQVSGFEALARWVHPTRGTISPADFLPALTEAGLMSRLGQLMLYHALTALKAWDSAGAGVPRVGVNFATEELRDPSLVERVRWELDRFGLPPERLAVEIVETVVADSPDDTVLRNIAGLGAMGCGIDLDDFGTGQASIAAIRRFSVSRIKIDRSFVTRADRDPDQQRMVGAILTLAERLELDTLAEGVETVGEHALLAQLGCGHVQGFGIARPMPFEQTIDWIAAHRAKLRDAPRIGRRTG